MLNVFVLAAMLTFGNDLPKARSVGISAPSMTTTAASGAALHATEDLWLEFKIQGVDVILLKVIGNGYTFEVRPTGCTIIRGEKRTVTNDETCKALIGIYDQNSGK